MFKEGAVMTKREEAARFLDTKFRAAVWRAETILVKNRPTGWKMSRSSNCPDHTSEDAHHHTLALRRDGDGDPDEFWDPYIYIRISFAFFRRQEEDTLVWIDASVQYWKRHPITKCLCGSAIVPAKLEIDLKVDNHIELLELMSSHLVESLAEECERSWKRMGNFLLGLETD